MVLRRDMMNLPAGGGTPAICCVAIVYAADGVRFVAVGPSRAVLVSRLAAYVMEQAPRQLWPDDASRVHQMMSGGALDVAIDLYFASVGHRWDKEWLHAEEIDLAAHRPHLGQVIDAPSTPLGIVIKNGGPAPRPVRFWAYMWAADEEISEGYWHQRA